MFDTVIIENDGLTVTVATPEAETIIISEVGERGLPGDAVGGAVSSVAGRTGDVVLTKSDVGLSNVDNTTDLLKPISTATQTALDGKAATSHSHAISDITSLQTALDGKAASTHAHAISEVTGLQTALDNKQASGSYASATHSHAIADVTGLQTALDGKQASGSYAAASHTHTKSQVTDFAHTHPTSEITGLDTALAGKAASTHSHAISDVTNLQTSLDAKQDTLVSGTNIKTVGGVSLLGTGDISAGGAKHSVEIMETFGSTIKGHPIGFPVLPVASQQNMGSGTIYLTAIEIPKAATISGLKIPMGSAGAYTAGAYNGVALYSVSGGILTLVASSLNDGNTWKTGFGLKSIAFEVPYDAVAAGYYSALLYTSSAQTTAPAVYGIQPPQSQSPWVFANGHKLTGSISGTSFPSTITATSISAIAATYFAMPY